MHTALLIRRGAGQTVGVLVTGEPGARDIMMRGSMIMMIERGGMNMMKGMRGRDMLGRRVRGIDVMKRGVMML